MKKLFDLRRVAMSKGALESGASAGAVTIAEVDSLNYRHGLLYVDVVATGVVTYTLTLEQSSNNSDWEDVPVTKFAEVTGGATDDEVQEVKEVTLKSLKRYVRAKLVTAGAGSADIAVVYALGDKDYTPTATEFLDN